MDANLKPDTFVDRTHPTVVEYAKQHAVALTGIEAAVALYYAVRDGFRHNPWRVRFTPDDFSGSDVLLRSPDEGAHCIDKALLPARPPSPRLRCPARQHLPRVRPVREPIHGIRHRPRP